MAEHRHVPEPGEVIYQPRSAWAPVVFAFALAMTICGIYAEGFGFRGWVYSIIAGVVAIFAFRSMIQEAIRDYFRLPRKQHVRGAVLPVETLSPPRS